MNDSTAQQIEEKKCLNCGNPLTGPYCHNCGQNNKYKRLDIWQLLGSFFQNIFNLDAAYPKTFIGLIKHPGIVSKQYVAGMRKRYANPFAYLVVAFALHVLLNATVIKEEVPALGGLLTYLGVVAMGAVVEGYLVAHSEEKAEQDDAARSEEKAEQDDSTRPWYDQESLTDFVNRYNTWLTYALIVPLAFIWAILFRKSQYNLAENYVFALYIFAQLTFWGLVWFLIMDPLVSLANSPLISSIANVLFFAVYFGYFVYAGKGFYEQKSFTLLFKFLASFVILIFCEMVVGVLVAIISAD